MAPKKLDVLPGVAPATVEDLVVFTDFRGRRPLFSHQLGFPVLADLPFFFFKLPHPRNQGIEVPDVFPDL